MEMKKVRFYALFFLMGIVALSIPVRALCVNYRPTVGGVTPSSGSGLSRVFISNYFDKNGWRNLHVVRLLFNTTRTTKGAVYFHYNQNNDRFYFFDGSRWKGGYRPRSNLTVSNSLAFLHLKDSFASHSGNRLTVRWRVTFKSPRYGKTLNTYLLSEDDGKTRSGWKKKGTWRVPSPTLPGGEIDFSVFPPDSPWNTDISGYPVDPNSDNYIASMGADTEIHPDFGTVWNGGPNGIPYVTVSGSQAKVPITFYYADESDPGPYPIPDNAPIEWGSDHHILVIDVTNRLLYEVYDATKMSWGWSAGSGAIFNLNSNGLRPDYWTSADAAGLPIFPGLVRYDEVEKGEINHALRFTVSRTQQGFVHPATHFASDETDTNLPPMGLRVRLKTSFDITGFSPRLQVMLEALKKYGMFVADNGGNWYISGAPDSRWNDDELHVLDQVHGSDFEVVQTGPIIR